MERNRILRAMVLATGLLIAHLTAADAQQVNPAAWEGRWTGTWNGNGSSWSFSLKQVQPNGRAIMVDGSGEREVDIRGNSLYAHRQYVDDEFRLNPDGTLSGTRDSQARGSYGKGSTYTITMTKSSQ